MAIISFSDSPEGAWCVAGWAFRQILDDVLSQNQNDEEMANEFERAIAISGLPVYVLDKNLAHTITDAIRNVANGILSGSLKSGIIEQPYGDATTVQQYLESLEDLLRTVPTK